MKKVRKKNKIKPAQRKKNQKKRENRQNKTIKNFSLKEGLKKTNNDKVLLDDGGPVKNLKSLIRDIFNLREARRQINFLGVDVKCISEHIGKKFINKCIDELNNIFFLKLNFKNLNKLINYEKSHQKK